MFRLAHISDPHLGPLPNPTLAQLASKRIFGYVNWRRNRKGVLTSDILDGLIEDIKAHDPDHLAVTGDLVNLALPAEITNAKRWLETLGNPENVSAIPGNHDAYVPRSRLKAEKAWQAYMCGDDDITHTTSFPYLRVRDNVALIGVNSAQATMPLMATGYFRTAQAQQLTTLLQQCSARGLFRVVMIHHPPCRNATHWHKRLIGAARFRAVIQNHGAELVLHGHTHHATQMTLDGPTGQIPVVCVPSASQGLGGRKPAARYNMFEIARSEDKWHCEWSQRGYSGTKSGITEIDRRALSIANT